MRKWTLGLVVMLAGCVNPDLKDDGYFTCSDEHPECPSGQSCVNGRCVKGGATSDVGVVDAGADQTSDQATDQATADGPLPDGPLPDGPLPDGPLPDGLTSDLPLGDQAQPVDAGPPLDLKPPPDQLPVPDGGPGPLTVLDPGGLPIAAEKGTEGSPAVAYGGGKYLVVWEKLVSGGDIRARLIPPTGVVKSGPPIQVATTNGSESSPDVAFDGTNFLVIWIDGYNHIRGMRINTSGLLVDPNPLQISATPSTHAKFSPKIAYNGKTFIAVWEDNRNQAVSGTDIYGNVFTLGASPGVKPDVKLSDVSGSQEQLSVTALGSTFLVLWDDQSVKPWHVNGRFVSDTGTVSSQELTISHPSLDCRFAEVASDGKQYLAVWQQGSNNIVGTRINSTGKQLDTPPKGIRAAAFAVMHPSIAFEGKQHLVVWSEFTGGAHDIYGTRITPALQVVGSKPVVISSAPKNQEFPDVAAAPGTYAVVWSDKRNILTVNGIDIFGARLQ